jgi:hypothetical protein
MTALSAKNSIDATSLKAVVLKNIQALRLVKKYPIPIFALFSLISGAI